MHALARLTLLLGLTLSVSACAPMLTMLGTNAAVVQTVATVERLKLAGDVTSFASSQKTLADHAVSLVTGKDCRVFNVVTKDAVCTDAQPATQTDVARGDESTQVAASATESNVIPAVRIDSLMAMPAVNASAVANAQDGFVAVAGTNLRRRTDASLDAPDSEMQPAPRVNVRPMQPALDLSRESASGD